MRRSLSESQKGCNAFDLGNGGEDKDEETDEDEDEGEEE